jgi:hypothetical protein
MTGYESEDDSSDVPCEWDACNDTFGTVRGMKNHHKRVHGVSIAGAKTSCEECGDTFRRKESHLEYHERNFCSVECRNKNDGYRDVVYATGAENHNWKPKIEKVCEWCDGEFEVIPGRSEQRFCSYGCKNEWQSETLVGEKAPGWDGGETVLECECCGDEYEVYLSHTKGRFCSLECAGKIHSEYMSGENAPHWDGGDVELLCEQCGDPFEVAPHRKDSARFWSYGCMGAWREGNIAGPNHHQWEGGAFPYGEGWTEAKRERIRERQGRECLGCGLSEAKNGRKLSVHHIVKARTLRDAPADVQHGDDNLVALCEACHPVWEQISPLRPQVE